MKNFQIENKFPTWANGYYLMFLWFVINKWKCVLEMSKNIFITCGRNARGNQNQQESGGCLG